MKSNSICATGIVRSLRCNGGLSMTKLSACPRILRLRYTGTIRRRLLGCLRAQTPSLLTRATATYNSATRAVSLGAWRGSGRLLTSYRGMEYMSITNPAGKQW
jgi:hypothetical protein